MRLTSENLEELHPELAPLFGKSSETFTAGSSSVHGPVLNGRFEFQPLRCGLTLFVMDVHANYDTELTWRPKKAMIGVGLVLGGSSRHVVSPTQARDLVTEFRSGENHMNKYQPEPSRFDLAGGCAHRFVELQLDVTHLSQLIDEREMPASGVLQSMFSPKGDARINVRASLSPALKYVAYQILHCPLEGAARKLFLESKALEILAHEVATFGEVNQFRSPKVKTDELDRLEQARMILEQEFVDPPSIISLARRVGLNDFKLKRGFRQVFDTTVFGYVRALRMDKARALLESGRLNVTQVASATGYSCFGHFSAAFKKRFGILPSDFRKAVESVSESLYVKKVK